MRLGSIGERAGKPAGSLNGLLSAIGFERWTIGARLALIVVALALPLNVLGIAVVDRVVHAANEAQRTSLLYAARSVAAGLDAQLDRYIVLAKFLASSPHLLDDDLREFEAEARRAFVSISNSWVVVADPQGRQILNTGVKARQPLPPRDPLAIAMQKRALETKSILVSDIFWGPVSENWVTTIEVPIFKNGEPYRELAVTMSMDGFLRLLNEQRMPQGWLAGIIDRQGRFVARVPYQERYVGTLASESWREVKDLDGVFDNRSLQGDDVVTANAHAARSGWTVGIAVKKAELQAAVWNTARPAIAVSAGLSVLSLLLAGLIAQRIRRPIAELRDKATALLEGPVPAFKPGTPEIEELWGALQRAAFERNMADAALRQLNERFVAGEEAGGGFVYDWNAKTDYCWRSEGLIRLLGYHPREVPPSSAGWFALMHPDDRSSIVFSPMLYGSADGRYSTEYRVKHRDGRWIWLWDRGRATTAPDGSLLRLIGSAIDVSERKEIETALAESENRARNSLAEIEAIYDTARIGLCVLDRELRYVRINERLAEMDGLPVADHIGKAVREIVPTIAHKVEEIAARVFETGQGVPDVELSGTTAAAPGSLRFWLEQWMPLRNASDEIIGANVVVEDITDRKKHEEQILLLMREVNHRAKNMLGVVQAIARHTVTSNPEDFVQRFSERLQALAMSQDLLIKNEWQGADLTELVRAQLAHFKDVIDTRVVLAGPPVRLTPAATQTIGMALHELATNAGKYGALSNTYGQVEISWKVYEFEPGKQRLSMSWIESGGPAVSAPARRGFGSTVVESMAQMGLSADVQLDYASSGLQWRLDCPGENALDVMKGPTVRR
ncbi:MAG: HWE histidine kinase domain-containing protein [Rhodomicrobium sp.]